MNLLFVIDHFGSGGAQNQIIALANGLARKEHRITFFIYYPEIDHFKDLLNDERIYIVEHKKKARFSLSVINALYNTVKRNNFDCILAFLGTPIFYSEIVKLFHRKVPLVISIRNAYPFGKISYRRFIQEQFHRIASYITVNSHHQRVLMEKIHPWMRKNICTIYNGIDINTFIPSNSNTGNQGSSNFLVLGSVRKLKNFEGLIQALKIYVQQYGNNIKINWAGRVSHNHKDLIAYKNANKYLDMYNINGQWNWLGVQDDIPSLINKHDAIILPSFHEGLPNAICEALACGKPVLASKVCDHPKLISEGLRGFLFDPHDPNNIADTLFKFCSLSPHQRLIMGRHARSFALKELSFDKYISSYEKLFIELSETKPGDKYF
jgi:glycosyltransferase involved in cell wall biosynthesis